MSGILGIVGKGPHQQYRQQCEDGINLNELLDRGRHAPHQPRLRLAHDARPAAG